MPADDSQAILTKYLPYLLFLKKKAKLKWSSVANYRYRFTGKDQQKAPYWRQNCLIQLI